MLVPHSAAGSPAQEKLLQVLSAQNGLPLRSAAVGDFLLPLQPRPTRGGSGHDLHAIPRQPLHNGALSGSLFGGSWFRAAAIHTACLTAAPRLLPLDYTLKMSPIINANNFPHFLCREGGKNAFKIKWAEYTHKEVLFSKVITLPLSSSHLVSNTPVLTHLSCHQTQDCP